MSKELNDLLNDSDKGIDEAHGVLAKLYRQILWDLNITPLGMNNLMIKWLDNPLNGIPNNGKTRSSERGNMIKEIVRPDMTWKVFLKCVRFLAPVELRFEVHLKWANKSVTVHAMNVQMQDLAAEDMHERFKEAGVQSGGGRVDPHQPVQPGANPTGTAPDELG